MNLLLQVIVAVPLFILFAWLARRLLGVRRLSSTKTIIAALVGFVVTEVIARVLIRQDFSTDLSVVAGLVLGLLATMLVIVGFEAVANPARSAAKKGGIPNPVAARPDHDEPRGAASACGRFLHSVDQEQASDQMSPNPPSANRWQHNR